ncbi:MAG: glycosyltransferase [Bacteroidetes bacterium]|nr:glycosyltransferase [Bacteroidota bacterium]
MLLQILFWFCILLIAHTYLFYPFWMSRKALEYHEREIEMKSWPQLDLLIAAYNEEKVIQKKIESCLNTNYPSDKIQLVIGSDRSNDQTDAIVQAMAEKDSRIRLVRFEERTGKPQIINHLVKESKADILILSDADTFFEPDMLPALVRPFANERVGGVQARFISETNLSNDVATQELVYNNRELMIKKGQSVNGVVIGAYGACYALKRNLYQAVPKGFLVDDFYLFMKVLEQGYQTVYAESAQCRLEVSGYSKTEFKRKARIGLGNYQNVFALKAFWNPFRNRASLYYWSHKMLRWLTPFLLILIGVSNYLLLGAHPVYATLFGGQVLVYALWPLDSLLKELGIRIGVLRFLGHFFRMNLALLLGFFRFLKGNASGTW